MLCQVCFQAEATMHVLDWPSDDPLVESHYCLACYETTYIHPSTGWIAVPDDPRPAHPPLFPRLRFSIKDLMIVAGLFAILNAAIAPFVRSALASGTPAQVRVWTIKAFLVANPFFAVFGAEMAILLWLRKRHLERLTAGVPLPHPRAIHQLNLWPIAWERASRLGRVFLILCSLWPGTWLLWFGFIWPRTAYRIVTGNDPLLVVASLLSIALGVQALLFWGLVASTRRR